MHGTQVEFCNICRRNFPNHFKKCRVVDIGSADVNGTNRNLFDGCEYVGVDLADGPNVDVVSLGHLYDAPDGSFDTAISTECFEHDPHWSRTFLNMIRLVRPGGLVLVTCATFGRPIHGTLTSYDKGSLSPMSSSYGGEFENYYRNLSIGDFVGYCDLDALFDHYSFTIHTIACDLYFWGIKTQCQEKSVR